MPDTPDAMSPGAAAVQEPRPATALHVRSRLYGQPATLRAEDVTVEYHDPGYQAADPTARRVMAALNPALALAGVLRWAGGAASFRHVDGFPEGYDDVVLIEIVDGPAAEASCFVSRACSDTAAVARRLSRLAAEPCRPGKPARS